MKYLIILLFSQIKRYLQCARSDKGNCIGQDYELYVSLDWRLSDDEEKLLITLCLALNPKDLDGGSKNLMYISLILGGIQSKFDAA